MYETRYITHIKQNLHAQKFTPTPPADKRLSTTAAFLLWKSIMKQFLHFGVVVGQEARNSIQDSVVSQTPISYSKICQGDVALLPK